MLTGTQLRAAAERLILLGLGYAVASGWLPAEIQGPAAEAILAVLACGYAVYNSRKSRLLDRAAQNVPGTTIIAPDAMAKATSSPNVVSHDDFQASPKT